MELKKMRELTEVELNTELGKMKKEQLKLRLQNVTGQLENQVQMREPVSYTHLDVYKRKREDEA